MTILEQLNLNWFQLTASPYQGELVGKKLGRPLFGGKNEVEVVAKLQYAFSVGAQVIEACGYADISTDSFYRYCKNNPEFRNKIELLQATPALLARMTIFQSLQDGNIKTAKWYLERKQPNEFTVNEAEESKVQQLDQRVKYLEKVLEAHNVVY